MTKNVLISMLRKGNTGDEILQILDAILNDSESDESDPTLEEIQF